MAPIATQRLAAQPYRQRVLPTLAPPCNSFLFPGLSGGGWWMRSRPVRPRTASRCRCPFRMPGTGAGGLSRALAAAAGQPRPGRRLPGAVAHRAGPLYQRQPRLPYQPAHPRSLRPAGQSASVLRCHRRYHPARAGAHRRPPARAPRHRHGPKALQPGQGKFSTASSAPRQAAQGDGGAYPWLNLYRRFKNPLCRDNAGRPQGGGRSE